MLCVTHFYIDIGDINNKDLKDNKINDNNARLARQIVLQKNRQVKDRGKAIRLDLCQQ